MELCYRKPRKLTHSAVQSQHGNQRSSFKIETRSSHSWTSLMAPGVKNLPAMKETQEIWVRSLGGEDPLEEEMSTHFSIFTWKIPWTEEPGGLQPKGFSRVGHAWATKHMPLIHSKVCSGFPLLPGKKLHVLQKCGCPGRLTSPVMAVTSSLAASSHTGLFAFLQQSKHTPDVGQLHWQSPCLEHSFPRLMYD